MADLTLKERLQPSLLDRLTDRAPDSQQESRDRRVLSVDKIRESVIRDLSWLLNTGNLGITEDLDDYPEVARSVLNYGAPELAGVTAAAVNISELEANVRQAIINFEPRILKDTLKVNIRSRGRDATPGMLQFAIEGQLWAQPMPIGLFLRTDLDLETGAFSVAEVTR
jgi:type VI secretion system protein ImpF